MVTEASGATPSGPSGLPVIGTALESRRALEFLLENRREYGDIVYYEFLSEPIYQLNHPDDIESVLVTNNQAYTKSHLTRDVLGEVAGDGLFTSDGTVWREQRRRIEPAFHPDQIEHYAGLMTEAAHRHRSAWSAGERVDINEAMRSLTLDIVARALLGVDVAADIKRIGQTLDTVFDRLGSPWYQLLPAWAPTPGNRRFRQALANVEAIVDRIIAERQSNPNGTDVLSRLLAADNAMSAQRLHDEVMTFLVAGHETTAQALTFTCYLLATHPRVEDRLVEELDEELGDDAPAPATIDDLGYTERVITEALRLYPPVRDIHREPVDSVDIRGYRIDHGATISMPPWVVHRDSRWYDDPETFRPERWTDTFRESLPRLAYFPFGAGPRRCIGDRFALMEAKCVLASLYQDCHLELDPETEFEVASTITTRPVNPVWMRIESR